MSLREDGLAPTIHAERAFNPSDRGNSAGGDHLVLDGPLSSGRLRRDAGDALCKPRAKFWGLYRSDNTERVCERCSEIAARHGLVR